MLGCAARPSIVPFGLLIATALSVATIGCRSAGPAPGPATAATPMVGATIANAGGTAPHAVSPAIEDPPEPLMLAPVTAPAPPTPTLAQVLIAPPTRIVSDVNALGRELPLRLGDQLMEALLKKAAEHELPIDAGLVAALGTDRPLALILIRRVAGRPGLCAAAPLARPSDAAAIAARLGAPLSRRGGAVERRSASGTTFWTGIADGTLLLAQTYDELWSIGARALAGTRAAVPAEEVVVTVDPEAIRAATGSTWDQMAAEIRKQSQSPAVMVPRAAKPGTPPRPAPTATMQKMMIQLGDGLALALSQTAHARVGIAASGADGFVASVSLEPKPGSALAASAAASTGFVLDDRLPVRDDRTGFTAWGSLGVLTPVLRALLPTSPRLRDSKSTGGTSSNASPEVSPIDGFLSAFSGGGSCTFELAESPPSSVCSLPLRPHVDARTALRRYADLVDAVMVWEADIVGLPHRPPPQIRKGVLEFERPLAATTVSAEQYATIRAFMGGDSVKYAAAVRGDRLLQFQGGAPRARLDAWTDRSSTKAGAPAATARAARPQLLEQALARTRGYGAATLLDPLALMFTMFEHAADPRSRQAAMMLRALPGLAATRTPLMLAAPAGPNVAYEFHIPVVTFDNIGKLIRPFAGIMGGAVGESAGTGAVGVP